MADSVVTFGGQANLAGDVRAQYLQVFTGEILQAFAEKNVYGARTETRTISSGKQAQWIVSWKGSARYGVMPGIKQLKSVKPRWGNTEGKTPVRAEYPVETWPARWAGRTLLCA